MSNETPVNPFQPPSARVEHGVAGGIGSVIPNGRKVSAGRGMAWLSEGWDLFKRAPGTFIGIALILIVIVMVVSFIPLANIAVNFLVPVFVGGIMLGCRSLEEGNGLEISHLFEGFNRAFGPLALLGLIYLIAAMISMIPLFIAIAMGVGGGVLASDGGSGASIAMIVFAVILGTISFGLVMLCAMAMYYAPALVVLHEVQPWEAFKSCIYAVLKNWLPFLVYSLVLTVLIIVAMIPLFLGFIVLVPVIYASMYATYRDIFVDTGE